MEAFKKYFSSLVIALSLSAPCFATQHAKHLYDQSQACENYYVQPGELYLAPNSIYASIDGVLIQINMLCADYNGIFVPAEEIAGRLVKCPFCQRWYDPDSKLPHDCKGSPD